MNGFENTKESQADRRAEMIKVWIEAGNDVEQLTTFKKVLEGCSKKSLHTKRDETLRKLIDAMSAENVEEGSRTHLDSLQDQVEYLAEIFIIGDELLYRGGL